MVKVVVRSELTWPDPIGPSCHQVFAEFCEKMQRVPWFLMGRTLLAVYLTGRLDESDTDIDVAVRVEDEDAVREALADWKVAQVTTANGRVQQLFYAPQDVLIDIHLFGEIPEHVGYVNMFDKWVTRPAKRFPGGIHHLAEYGDVKIPLRPERFLHDDYGPGWRDKYK